MKKVLFSTVILLLFACQTDVNPFFQEWNTPFGVPPFKYINDEHYMPAFEKGMEQNLKEIEIISNNSEEPTFSNTIEELERTGKLLSKVQRTFFNLVGSNTSPKLQELQRTLSPILSSHYDKIVLNNNLFLRIEKLWQNKENLNLTNEQLKLLNDTRKQFVRSGSLLNEEEKEKITEINSKVSALTTLFGQNLLAETNGFELILSKSDLDGLSEDVINAASETAIQKMNNAKT